MNIWELLIAIAALVCIGGMFVEYGRSVSHRIRHLEDKLTRQEHDDR